MLDHSGDLGDSEVGDLVPPGPMWWGFRFCDLGVSKASPTDEDGYTRQAVHCIQISLSVYQSWQDNALAEISTRKAGMALFLSTRRYQKLKALCSFPGIV